MGTGLWRTTLPLVAVLIPAASQAGWYLGAEAGRSNADSIDINFDTPPDLESDDQDTVYSLFGGLTFGSNLALELGYADLGEYSATQPGTLDVKIEPTAYYLSAIGKVSVHPRVKLFGRLGVAYWSTDLSLTDFVDSSSGDDSGYDPLVGLGFEWSVLDRMDLRVEWEQFQNVGQDTKASIPAGTLELNGNDIDIFGVGLTYHFDLAPGP